MVKGAFFGNSPYIQITLGWHKGVKNYWFILDTGFTGDLQIPHKWAEELGMTPNSVVATTIANGQVIQVHNAIAMSIVEGIANYVRVGLSDGSPLLGIDFLTKFGYKAVVDCKHRTVEINKP